jgi:hypothetical protein
MTARYLHVSDEVAVKVAKVLDFSDKQIEQCTEPEREQLKQLADTEDIEVVRKALKVILAK